ncbi:transposase [Methylotuvimicrobium sp. KM1]|uniref:transposase n=1 Tax=Methylotuvimicrobium sp. KM1 TaxID=3377707 RepID=UPI00384A54DD
MFSAFNREHYIEFIEELVINRGRPLILFLDHATLHHAKPKPIHQYVNEHRTQLRIYFLPKRSPEFNPDEQVWNEIKNNRSGEATDKNKSDLKERITMALEPLKHYTERICSFFRLEDTLRM